MKSEMPARRVTIRDVSRVAGVSLTTVSHALNDRGSVDPATRARVKQVAANLGYTPNVRAQRLRSGQSNSIAIVSSMPFAVSGGSSRLGFMMEIAAIAAEEAMKRGLALVFVPPVETATRLLQGLDIDGAIVIEPLANDPNIKLLQDRGVTLVTVGRQPEQSSAIPYVDLQSELTAGLLLEHLYSQGGRRIALLQGSAKRASYQENAKAYQHFVETHGLTTYYAEVDEEEGEAGGERACRKLLEKYPDLDAICIPVDAFATGFMRQAALMGKVIPTDLMVATRYDGLRARTATPALTAINLHLMDIASLAVELLFESISGKKPRNCVTGPMPKLVVRDSTSN